MEKQEVSSIESLIKDIRMVMLTTMSSDGSFHSRPMATLSLEKGIQKLYFFTSDVTPKSFEIKENSVVNLSYVNVDQGNYISLSGTAKVLKDKKLIKQFWTPSLREWFPQGESDPHLALIEVTPNKVQKWIYPNSVLHKASRVIGISNDSI